MTRVCKKCGVEKELNETQFRRYSRNPGFRLDCTDCEKAAHRRRDAILRGDPQEVLRAKAYQEEYRRTHKKDIADKRAAKSLAGLSKEQLEKLLRKRANRDANKIARREWDSYLGKRQSSYPFLLKYGLTVSGYLEFLERQAGGCAICGKESADKAGRPLHVDHCHSTGRVRGLLCIDCNTSLGKMQESPDLLLRAVEYILSH